MGCQAHNATEAYMEQIWQIADNENRGLLTKPGFCVALRLIAHYQAGRNPSPELAFKRESKQTPPVELSY